MQQKAFCYRIDFDADSRPIEITYLKAGNIRIDKNKVAITKFEYGDNFEKRSFFNERGDKTYIDVINCHSLKIEQIDDSTKIVSFYDINDKQIPNNSSITYEKYVNESLGDCITLSFLDINHDLIIKNSISHKKYYYDEQHYLTGIHNYNVENSIQNNDNGIAIVDIRYSSFYRKKKLNFTICMVKRLQLQEEILFSL